MVRTHPEEGVMYGAHLSILKILLLLKTALLGILNTLSFARVIILASRYSLLSNA